MQRSVSSSLPAHAQKTAAGRDRPWHRRAPRLAAAFSFVEVLFAVMILGVGFIMLAAMFPVAIQQAQTNSDETVSAAIAWNALTTIQEKLTDMDLLPARPVNPPPTLTPQHPGLVRSFRDPQAIGVPWLKDGMDRGRSIRDDASLPPVILRQPKDYLWNRIKGESVVVDDRRYAWVAFYQRHIRSVSPVEPFPYAQVMVVVVRSRERSEYGAADLGNDLANLQPRPVTFNLTGDGAGPRVDQVVRFTGGAASVAEGSYLVVAFDRLPAASAGGMEPPYGFMNSHVFRIGNSLGDNRWELSPETEFRQGTVDSALVNGLTNASGYVIGRTRTGTTTEGQAQDVAVYTMMIAVR